ncbi:MAG: MurR/RpiR family transcriptional regulator [Candidatus Nanopelagicales bacterium]
MSVEHATADHPQPLSAQLLERMDALTASERSVARVILTDYPMSGLDSIASLASKSSVSPPTVLRLVAKLGFAGWPQFQAALREEVAQRLASPLAMYDQRRGATPLHDADYAEGIFIRALETSFARLKGDVVDEAVRALTDPKSRIHVIGGRFSTALAVYFATHLQLLRPHVSAVSEIPIHRSNALLDMGRNDIVVALDFRRYQRDTIEFGTAAAQMGARIILFTDPWLSPLVNSAKTVITVETTSPSPFDSFVSAMGVLELLIHRISESVGDDSLERMKALDELNQDLMVGGREE